MEKLTTLDQMTDEMFDHIVEKWGNNAAVKIHDAREEISFDNFLISSACATKTGIEWKMIWIHGNLWQYGYTNTHCATAAQWVDPVQILNDLLEGKTPAGVINKEHKKKPNGFEIQLATDAILEIMTGRQVGIEGRNFIALTIKNSTSPRTVAEIICDHFGIDYRYYRNAFTQAISKYYE